MSAAIQLGFDGLLSEAETGNRRHRLDRESAHLPGELEAAIRHHRTQIRAFHAAVQAQDFASAEKIDAEAHLMAVRENHGEPGILAGRDSPGRILGRRCAAKAGAVPLFGQEGRFRIEVAGAAILIAMDGMFGLGGTIPGFAAHAVDFDRPFISETGYRSFLGCWIRPAPGMSTADHAAAVIAAHIAGELKGKLRPIAAEYRRTKAGRAA